MKFDKKYFQKFEHDQDGIKQYLHNAKRDYKIAQTDELSQIIVGDDFYIHVTNYTSATAFDNITYNYMELD